LIGFEFVKGMIALVLAIAVATIAISFKYRFDLLVKPRRGGCGRIRRTAGGETECEEGGYDAEHKAGAPTRSMKVNHNH
jgi:hypothetical protein